MQEILDRVKQEAGELEQECVLRAKDHFVACGRWDRIHLFLGIPTTLIAGITSVAAMSDIVTKFGYDKDIVSGVLALIVAGLTALTTFLNPSERATAHKTASSTYDIIRMKSNLLKDIDLSVNYASLDEPTKEIIKQLKEITNQFSALGQSSPRVPRSIYNTNRSPQNS